MTTPEIFADPLWPTLRANLYIAQENKIGINGPRHRIEVHRDTCPPSVLGIVVPCAACHAPIHPVRETERHVWTFNVSCPLRVNHACARSKKSHAMATAIRAAIGRLT